MAIKKLRFCSCGDISKIFQNIWADNKHCSCFMKKPSHQPSHFKCDSFALTQINSINVKKNNITFASWL